MEVEEIAEIPEWTTEPAAFHSLIFSGGKTVLIEFYFDNAILTLENYKPVEDLNDLCFIFDRNTDYDDYEPEYPIDFRVEFGERKISFADRNKKSARIRIGAVLSYHIQESRIEFQGNRKLDQPDLKLTVHARQANMPYLIHLAMEGGKFEYDCGTRGIRVTDPEPVNTLIPTEIAALFSPFFHSLFYGNYKERMEKFVEVQNVKTDTILEIIYDSCLKNLACKYLCEDDSYRLIKLRLLENIAEELDHCDRFMFNQSCVEKLAKTGRICVGKLQESEIDERVGNVLLEISAILRNNGLLLAFLGKICMSDTLEAWEKGCSEEFPADFAALIAERKIQLHSIRSSRKTLSLHYERGSIVCELFTDFHPLLVQDFIQYVLEESDEAVLKDIPSGINLNRKLQRDEYSRAAIFDDSILARKTLHPTVLPLEYVPMLPAHIQAQLLHQQQLQQLQPPPTRFYLMYIDEEKPRVAMFRKQVAYGWLIGVVTDGLDLLTTGRRGALIGAAIEPVDVVMEADNERLV